VGILFHITNSLLEELKQKMKGNKQTKERKRLEDMSKAALFRSRPGIEPYKVHSSMQNTSARMEHTSNQ
jgi:hypothetical protein